MSGFFNRLPLLFYWLGPIIERLMLKFNRQIYVKVLTYGLYHIGYIISGIYRSYPTFVGIFSHLLFRKDEKQVKLFNYIEFESKPIRRYSIRVSGSVQQGMDGLGTLIHTTKIYLPKCRKDEISSFCLNFCQTLKGFFNYQHELLKVDPSLFRITKVFQ